MRGFRGRIKYKLRKMKHILLTIILLLLTISNAIAQQSFQPWYSEILIADQLHASNSHTHAPVKTRPVFSGIKGGMWLLIVFFQKIISPQDGPSCRHIPVCSAYGKHAVEKHGALIGSFLAGERLLRCTPFYPPSHDPVPKEIFDK